MTQVIERESAPDATIMMPAMLRNPSLEETEAASVAPPGTVAPETTATTTEPVVAETSNAVTPAVTVGPTGDVVNTPAEATVLIDVALTTEALVAAAQADAVVASDDWHCTGCTLRRPKPQLARRR